MLVHSSPDAGPAMAGNHGSVIIVICLLTCRYRLPSSVLGGAGKIVNPKKKLIAAYMYVHTLPPVHLVGGLRGL